MIPTFTTSTVGSTETIFTKTKNLASLANSNSILQKKISGRYLGLRMPLMKTMIRARKKARKKVRMRKMLRKT
jgi:aspartyl-tRNA synthetase